MIHSRQTVIARTLATAACTALVAAACVAGVGASPSNAPELTSPGLTSWATGSNATSGHSTPMSSPAPAGTGSTAPATPAGPTSTTELGEADSGRTLTVSVGATVKLVLHNIYWTVHDSPDPSVMTMVGQPVYSGAGAVKCIPGTGCGTVTATFKALAPGNALISASRSSCGEALQCTGGAGMFEVTVVVAP
ncbi:MAG: hypothetical protein ABSE70_04600 [Candidatus Limnocylindrales bacterium]